MTTHTFTRQQSSKLRAILGLPADAGAADVYAAACAQLDARAAQRTQPERAASTRTGDADTQLYAAVWPDHRPAPAPAAETDEQLYAAVYPTLP